MLSYDWRQFIVAVFGTAISIHVLSFGDTMSCVLKTSYCSGSPIEFNVSKFGLDCKLYLMLNNYIFFFVFFDS